MPNVSFSGNFQPQLTSDSKNQPVPLQFLATYAQKMMEDLVFTGAQANVAVAMGTITTPSVVLVQCDEGQMDIAFEAFGGTPVPISLVADATPAPTYKPFFLFFCANPAALALFIRTPGAARGKVWIFQ